MSKIIRLSLENVQRISAVEINPQGNLVVISGKNGAGKSTVLNAIKQALCGSDSLPEQPLRRGASRGEIDMDIGEYRIRRTFTAAGGTQLIVSNKDGLRQLSPQAILDGLYSQVTIDPLEFTRLKPEARSEVLRGLLGLNFAESDAEHERLYDLRTSNNRLIKELTAQISGAPKFDNLPDVEIDTTDILRKQTEAVAQNAANAKLREEVDRAAMLRKSQIARIEDARAAVTDLEGRLATARKELTSREDSLLHFDEQMLAKKMAAEGLADVPTATFTDAHRNAQITNQRIRANKLRDELVVKLKAAQKSSEDCTKKMEDLSTQKRQTLIDAKYPVAGLSMDPSGNVLYNGLPFDQASTAEQLRISVAMGIAMNPKLRILLIRAGNDLDEDGLKILDSVAVDADAQIWIERIVGGTEAAILIEDGHLATPKIAKLSPEQEKELVQQLEQTTPVPVDPSENTSTVGKLL